MKYRGSPSVFVWRRWTARSDQRNRRQTGRHRVPGSKHCRPAHSWRYARRHCKDCCENQYRWCILHLSHTHLTCYTPIIYWYVIMYFCRLASHESYCRKLVCLLRSWIVATMRDRHMVSINTWEIDIGLSQSAKLTLNDIERVIWRSRKLIEPSVWTVAPRSRMPVNKNVHRCHLSKGSWPLTLNDL